MIDDAKDQDEETGDQSAIPVEKKKGVDPRWSLDYLGSIVGGLCALVSFSVNRDQVEGVKQRAIEYADERGRERAADHDEVEETPDEGD